MTTPAVALTIAGLDPTGGAGLAADLRTFDAFGVHGAVIVTTLTAQDTVSFARSVPSDIELLSTQIELLLADLEVGSVKIGMVPTAEILGLLTDWAPRFPGLVLDPVAVDRHGAELVGSHERDAMLGGLLPMCEIVTPNRAELAWLLDTDPASEDDVAGIEIQARELQSMGVPWVLVTGGRVGKSEAVDLLVGQNTQRIWREPRLQTHNDRGSGCTLSAAISAGLAQGVPVERAVETAHKFVQRALVASQQWQIGSGTGPVAQRLAGRDK